MNYLEFKNAPRSVYSFRITESLAKRLDGFSTIEQSRLEKIIYLTRLFNAINPKLSIIPEKTTTTSKRLHRSGNQLPEDVILIIRQTSAKYRINLTQALDLIIIIGLKLSKIYSLNVIAVKK